MKLKLITLLFISTLFMGCAKNTNENNISETKVQITNESEAVNEAVTDIVSETAQNMENNESAAEKEAESEKKSETEPYVVNFKANAIDGRELSSDIFSQSKLTMINIWATYCNPCLNEMPDLGEIANEYDSSEFQMIGIISDVTEDADENTINNAKDLIAKTKADYPHLLLNESLYSNLVGGVDSVPTTFFVNEKGELLGYIVGANSKEGWESVINELLSQVK